MDVSPTLETKKTGFRFLDWVERIGNKLPDPVTLFFMGALLVLIGSEFAVRFDWTVQHPTQGTTERAKSLLSSEGMEWVWMNMIKNFTGFHPLGVVLVAMIGIGVAERTGLIGALLKGMVLITPQTLLTPAVIFVGINSSMATDAGYVVLPPLAAAVYAKAGRSPLVGLAAVFAGVASGFSANILLTGLDPLLQGLTEESAQLMDKNYHVRPDCNYYFMLASTFVMTFVGWGVTKWFVEKRFTKADVDQQLAEANFGAASPASAGAEGLTKEELKGLWAALVVTVLAGAGVMAMILIDGAPLHGTYPKPTAKNPDNAALVWPEVIVPILFVMFLLPGIAYGIAAKVIRSDRDVARMMGASMSSMGMYIVLAFFAAQFVEWFKQSNIGLMLAIEGVSLLKQFDLSPWQLVVAIIALVAVLNLFLGSASAKWALISPVFVPLFMGLGISPELTQAAYRVGDSCTNSIAPLNPYLVVILVFMQKYMPKAGLGSLVALMLPYAIIFLIAWTALLLLWVGLDIPLGPGKEPLFIEPIAVTRGE
jgi:aminobenzoyl-glutamate transport protein